MATMNTPASTRVSSQGRQPANSRFHPRLLICRLACGTPACRLASDPKVADCGPAREIGNRRQASGVRTTLLEGTSRVVALLPPCPCGCSTPLALRCRAPSLSPTSPAPTESASAPSLTISCCSRPVRDNCSISSIGKIEFKYCYCASALPKMLGAVCAPTPPSYMISP